MKRTFTRGSGARGYKGTSNLTGGRPCLLAGRPAADNKEAHMNKILTAGVAALTLAGSLAATAADAQMHRGGGTAVRSGGFRSGGTSYRSGGYRSGGYRSGGYRSGGYRGGDRDRFGFGIGIGVYPGYYGYGYPYGYGYGYGYGCSVWDPYYGAYVRSPYCGNPYGYGYY
jgi:hypothetical protein